MKLPPLFDPIKDPRALRDKAKLNQLEFWGNVGVQQSGGSRYERGDNIPPQVYALLRLVYLPTKDVALPAHYVDTDGSTLPALFAPIPELRALRKASGMNQLLFWQSLGVSQSGGSRYESGRNIFPALRALIRLKYLDESL